MVDKSDLYEKEVWPRWMSAIRESPDRLILLHGIMGSELCERTEDETLWIDLGVWHELDDLEYAYLTPRGSVDANDQLIYARSTVHPPIVDDPYRNILAKLKPGTFNYDWRESIPIEAARLGAFLRKLLEGDRQPVQFVAHSMGGCVLLQLLLSTREFDDVISKIIFCAPPFHGALKPLRVIENGDGTPADSLIRASTLRQSAASLPGLFDLLVAPPESWVATLPNPAGGEIRLQHPIRTGQDLYRANAWTNLHRSDLRDGILQFAERYHDQKWNGIEGVLERLGKKIWVIVGLNGKTLYAGQKDSTRGWTLHAAPDAPEDQLSNGDGTVLFQSSYLPGLPLDRYWAYWPAERGDTHGGLVDTDEVIRGIRAILDGKEPALGGLHPYKTFFERIDWRQEIAKAPPRLDEHLDHLERAHARSVTPRTEWTPGLNPGNEDALLFFETREAAMKVLKGEDVGSAARRLGMPQDFLMNHVRRMLMPVLFG